MHFKTYVFFTAIRGAEHSHHGEDHKDEKDVEGGALAILLQEAVKDARQDVSQFCRLRSLVPSKRKFKATKLGC
jgi:hypothetical protein